MNKIKQEQLEIAEKEFLKLAERNLQEWNSKEDDEQFAHLQSYKAKTTDPVVARLSKSRCALATSLKS